MRELTHKNTILFDSLNMLQELESQKYLLKVTFCFQAVHISFRETAPDHQGPFSAMV